jgi:predicted ArsR family transcriptional regulator
VLNFVFSLLIAGGDINTLTNMDQPKIERVLRLMKLLTANNCLTIDEMADKLGLTPRTVYRYIDTFRDAGFVVTKANNWPRLIPTLLFKDIKRVDTFYGKKRSPQVAIESIDEINLLKQNQKKKLYTSMITTTWPIPS